jgi:hypothetical protein
LKHLYLLLLTVLTCFSAHSTTIYVDASATGANSGANWTDAFLDLQDAIGLSTFGDDIWVVQGTYKPTSGTDRNTYFVIKNGTKLYGGFSGIETSLNQRAVATNVTVLSGEIGSGSATDNSGTVVYFGNVANQTRVDGFTITAAYNTNGSGGGARVVASSPVIANCIFLGNHAGEGGGALNHSTSGILTLDSCVFDGNVGNTYGGGALRLYTGTVNISNCYFKSNQSDTYGGAMFIYGAIVNISNSVFAGNISQTSGSAIRVFDVGTLHLSNSLVVGNYTSTSAAITSSTFSNTSAHTITNCTITGNKQDNSGGSSTASTVALNDEATITNSIIYGNVSTIQVLGTGLTFDYNITENVTNNATGTNILYTDPQFVLPGVASAAPFDTTGFNYELDLLSEGVDVGLNASVSGVNDLAGNARIYNNTVDLGAFEKLFCVSTSQFTTAAPYAVCGGIGLTLAVNGGVSHQWSNGSTSDSIIVGSAGTYSVIFEDSSGCRGTLAANVTASPNPTPTITFQSGNLDAGSYSSYQWYFNGNLIIGASNSTHIPIEGYGLYEVYVQNASGCDGSTSYCLSPATLSADGPTSFCDGEDVNLFVAAGNSYVWSSGSLDSAITVNSSGTYSVTVLNSNAGCSVVLEQDVVVYPNPNPVINFTVQTLSTSVFTSYQWNFNGSPIAGAIAQNLDATATGNGQYTVTVTNADGCEATSGVYDLTNLGVKDNNLSSVEFYPNPIRNGSRLTIELSESMGTLNQIELHSSTGVSVFKTQISESQISINLPLLASGLYFITISNSEHAISGIKLTVL